MSYNLENINLIKCLYIVFLAILSKYCNRNKFIAEKNAIQLAEIFRLFCGGKIKRGINEFKTGFITSWLAFVLIAMTINA